MNVAATLQSTPGPVIAANYIATNAVVQPSLGRPLSGGAANVTVNLVEPNTMFGDRVNQLDVRLGKTIRFGQRRAMINLDIYNVLNSSVDPAAQQQLRRVADAAAHHGRAAVQDQRPVRLLIGRRRLFVAVRGTVGR